MKFDRPIRYVLIAAMVAILTPWMPSRVCADLHPMADGELAGVSGSGGISIGIGDVSIYMYTGFFSYTDTDTGNALSLEGISLTGGGQQLASFAVGNIDTNGDGLQSPLTIDVGAIDDPSQPAYGEPVVRIEALDWSQAVDIHADTLRFCGEALGSLDIGVIQRPTFYWTLGAHSDGIDFEMGQRVSVDAVQFTYNTPGDNITIGGIHMGAIDLGAPENPATWQMTGTFRIGALAEGNPATFDVGENTDGIPIVSLNLPMNGSVRAESVRMGGTVSFGPVAIDGIQVHHMNVQLVP